VNYVDVEGLKPLRNPWEERISNALSLCDKNGNFDCSIINDKGGEFCTRYAGAAMYPCRQAMTNMYGECEMKGIKCWGKKEDKDENKKCDK
jgi:hypothetical protein